MEIPPEWNKEAFVEDKFGKKIIDIRNHNLHLISYSRNIKKIISKKELFRNLHFLKKQPNAIPYITSYYEKKWGFCISYNQYKKFNKIYKNIDKFKIVINSNYNNKGYLKYGEIVIGKQNKQEILISTYICHPSMANELSGQLLV